ncbi:FHA domain-containing protein [Micromonospora sp. CPCC 205371]|nr:FHA domain-containing protein [Micromonospora sp. CPCC 205371]
MSPRQPDPTAPFEAVLLIPGAGEAPTVRYDGPSVVLVEGVHCANGHFNDPALRYCQLCGISMAQLTHVTTLGPRPPLGVLLLDDGATFRLDADYVVGRDPHRNPAVAAGSRALRVSGAVSGVSRHHLRISLDGWTVRATDLGSVNGTHVEVPGESGPRRLDPGKPAEIPPGTRVRFGSRWLRYESHRNP